MTFFQELKRRNVAKVAVLYVVAAWLILQVAELLFDAMSVSDEMLRFLIAILVLGFPLVTIFSWVFEITPEGVKFERDVDRSQSIAGQTGQRINTTIIILLIVAVASIAVDRLIPEQAPEPVSGVEEEVTETVVAENSIAVLPFADLSADGDQEYFSDGIAEEILNVLVRTEGLEVASRTTSFGFKGQEALGLSVIADRMNVRHILEGSVRKAGRTVRITAQLIDAESDKHLWSETYDRELTAESIFSIQDEIAGAIVEQLGTFIAVDETRPSVVADTESLEAYELYLAAHKHFIERGQGGDVGQAIELFEQAVATDPGFARAWAGLAAAFVVADGWAPGFRSLTYRDYLRLGREAAEKAISLNPDLPLAYAAIASDVTERLEPDWEAALENYDKAIQLDPKEATVLLWRGITYLDLGYFEPAIRDIERCIEIDPAYGNCRSYLALAKLVAGDTEAALALFERGLLNGYFGNIDPFHYLYAAEGRHDALLYALSVQYSWEGKQAWIEPAFNAYTDRDFEFEEVRDSAETSYRLVSGEDLNWKENQDIAFLFKNYAAIEGYTDWPFVWFPYPEDFRQSPHRKRLLNDLGIHAYWREHGFPPQCRPIGDDDFECD